MQRTLHIYINNQPYKDITVEASPSGNYHVGVILAMLNKDRASGAFDSYNIPPGTFPVRITLSH